MNYPPVCAFIPIKKNSERVPGKNVRLFNGAPLYTHLLQTLEAVNEIDKVLINTDNEELASEATKRFSKVKIVMRSEKLRAETTQGNELIDGTINETHHEHFLKTHVTSPLLKAETISLAIKQYFENLDKYDSLFSVTEIKARCYTYDLKPINHQHAVQMLGTQALLPVLYENSSFFIFSKNSFYGNNKSRIGKSPSVYTMSPIEAVDIDYEEDFILAELIHRNKKLFPEVFQ